MDNLAHAMHVVETNEALSGELSCKRHRNSLVVVALNDLEEVDAEDLEHHHKVLSVWPVVDERVEQLNAVRSITTHSILVQRLNQVLVLLVVRFDRIVPLLASPILGNLIKDFHFIVGSFEIMLGAFLYLDGDITIVLQIFCEPDCGEMTPAELLNDDISIHQNLANMDGMIPSNLVVRHALVLTTVLVIEERVVNLLL